MSSCGRDSSPNPWQMNGAYSTVPDNSKSTRSAKPRISTPSYNANFLTGRSQPLGLFRLDSSSSSSDIVDVDVIAVHGLNGNAFTTWTNKKSQLWLQEFLPRSLPKARIYTFGYDSSIFSQSKAGIEEYARKLLSELSLVRQSETDQRRRIIFICHSLGGIVCKKALVLAHESSQYINILQSTKAMVFFGTPHRGSEHAEFLSALAGIIDALGSISMIRHLFGRIRNDLIRQLFPCSKELEEISVSFTERVKNLNIISFYEEYAMPPFKTQIVLPSSARIGVPNEDLIPLSDNHKDMCRLDNEHTLAYRKIVQVCQRHGAASYRQGQARTLDIQEQECLRALNMIDMKESRAQLHPRMPGSCEWILSNMAFRKWISDNNSTLLHLTGGIGTGKSIITSFLADRIKPLIETAVAPCEVTVCSFFCDDKDIGRKNGRDILRSLLHQILQQRHDLIQHATTRFSQIPSNQWSLNALWETLVDITLNPTAGTIVVIIDAIDECEIDSRDRILAMMRKLLTQGPKLANSCIKFLISSRPRVDLMEEIQQYSASISLDNEDGLKNRDIPLVVKYQLNRLAADTQWTAEIREALEKSIVMKAGRNFLWVRLVIQRLRNGPQNKKFFERVVNESPKDLDGMYCCILSDIDIEYQTLASKVLRVLVASLRPLTTAELQLALAISLDHRTLKSVEEDSDMAIERTIRLALGAFVGIYDSKVQLTHQSAKEFLLRRHLEIARVLLHKSNQPQVNGQDENGRTPLSWAVGSSHLQIVQLLLSREDIDVNIVDWAGSPPLFWAVGSNPQGQHLAVLEVLVSEPRVNISQRDRSGRTVLSWAAEMGALEAVNIIIQSQRSDIQILLSDTGDSKGWSPLSWAAFYGHDKVVEVLCKTSKAGAQLASVDRRGQNAVSLAADRGQAEIIKVLAKYHPEGIDWPEETGRTPLSCAMWGSPGNEETVRTLLQTQLVDVNQKALNGRTPLSYAVSAGRADLVRILVEEGGADLSITDNDGRIIRDMNIDWRSSQVKEEIDHLTGLQAMSN